MDTGADPTQMTRLQAPRSSLGTASRPSRDHPIRARSGCTRGAVDAHRKVASPVVDGFPKTPHRPEDGMAKRANGEGSIFRRKDGTWSAQLSYRDDYGSLKRRTVYGHHKRRSGPSSVRPAHASSPATPVKDSTVTVSTW